MGDVKVVEVEPKLVLGFQKMGHYGEIGSLIDKVQSFARRNSIRTTGPLIFICHEDTQAEAFRANREGTCSLEVCVPIAEKCQEKQGFRCYELLGGKMARVTHRGPYSGVSPAYDKLYKWLKKHDRELFDHIREVYVNDPKTTPREELVIEIYAPIE